jgi:hypothetical protein
MKRAFDRGRKVAKSFDEVPAACLINSLGARFNKFYRRASAQISRTPDNEGFEILLSSMMASYRPRT